MFSIVANVEKYPEFLPWCIGARVRNRKQRNGRQIEEADLMVGFKGLTQTYTSEVTLDSDALTIDAVQLRGPFHHLVNQWRFPCGRRRRNRGRVLDRFRFQESAAAPLINRWYGEAVEPDGRVLSRRARQCSG